MPAGRDHCYTKTDILKTWEFNFGTLGIHFGGPVTDGDSQALT